jgi:CheY-like chemotaxis protein
VEKKRILLIDDDSRNIFALTAVLRARGFVCLSCLGAPEALQLLREGTQVDAILIDMMMPEMDGYEAIPRIRALDLGKRVPILAVTAQAMVGDREKCLRAGADAYISKPIDVDQLLAELDAVP